MSAFNITTDGLLLRSGRAQLETWTPNAPSLAAESFVLEFKGLACLLSWRRVSIVGYLNSVRRRLAKMKQWP